MDSATLLQLKGSIFPSPPPLQPYLQSNSFNLENKVSPSVLLIIIILAIVFFVSGLLHLLVRFLWSPPSQRDPESIDNVTAFQGQLQQLFHLHDSGVDQSFIDTLPVFHYKAIIIGSKFKTPFDCAVCLCEFESEDKLRLLPKCSHAFHTQCIDTWLLSHSTCPLCRSSLLPDQFSQNTNFSPIVLLLESGPGNDESSRDHVLPERSNISQMGHEIESGLGEIVTVKLGKYKNIDGGRGETEGGSGEVNKNVDSRRCFSMGSFEYVMDENSSLKVTISNTPVKSKKLPLIPGYRPAMSECDCESRREFKISGFEPFFTEEKLDQNVYNNGSKIEKTGRKKESFSVSKIWLRENKKKKSEGWSINSSRRAVSFRFPVQFNENEEDFYEGNHQSLAKKSLLWLMGRQKKVNFHFQSSSASSSLPSNI